MYKKEFDSLFHFKSNELCYRAKRTKIVPNTYGLHCNFCLYLCNTMKLCVPRLPTCRGVLVKTFLAMEQNIVLIRQVVLQ